MREDDDMMMVRRQVMQRCALFAPIGNEFEKSQIYSMPRKYTSWLRRMLLLYSRREPQVREA
jgi:hypothetical protein